MRKAPRAARGGEQVIAAGIVDHGLGQHALVLQGDGNGVLREAVEKVGGAVERVDDPLVLRVALGAAFFC